MLKCNIDTKDRINRAVLGGILLFAALLHAGRFVMIIIGLVLLIEGAIGWCGIPILVEKLTKWMESKTKKSRK